jgi:hypothetical protein
VSSSSNSTPTQLQTQLPPLINISRLLLPLDIPRRGLQAVVALLVGAPRAEADADQGGPGAALEEQDGEDHAEAQAEGGLDDEVGEAAVPLWVVGRLVLVT